MFDQVKQLMQMKKQAEQIKRELDSTIVESNDVRGIKLTLNGSQTFQSVEIAEDQLNPDNKVQLENNLQKAINAAIKKSQNVAAKKMQGAMPGLPGMFN